MLRWVEDGETANDSWVVHPTVAVVDDTVIEPDDVSSQATTSVRPECGERDRSIDY